MPRNQKIQCNPPYDCFNCPYEDCMKGTSHGIAKMEQQFLKAAQLPIRGGIISIAKDLKYARSERLV